MIEQWIPTIVCGGALGLIWFGIRGHRKEVDSDVDDVKEDYLRKDEHELRCENASLKVNEHLTAELTSFKNDIFKELRSINTTIKNNNK